eukprot:4605535-Alexandrium_andersonii.AAC.1
MSKYSGTLCTLAGGNSLAGPSPRDEAAWREPCSTISLAPESKVLLPLPSVVAGLGGLPGPAAETAVSGHRDWDTLDTSSSNANGT